MVPLVGRRKLRVLQINLFQLFFPKGKNKERNELFLKMKRILQKINLKNLSCKNVLMIYSGIFFIALILFLNNWVGVLKNVYYNQDMGALAAEDKPINCRKQAEVQLPFGVSAQLGPNEFEIPIGEVTDMTESVAERIMTELQIIIDASILEAAAAGQMIDLAGQCGIARCTTPGCALRYFDCEPCLAWSYDPDGMPLDCIQWSQCSECPPPPPCGGQACPGGISDKLREVSRQADIVSSAYNQIKGILIDWKPKKPVGNWWHPGCAPEFPVIPGCLSEKEFILKELERARSGDYEILGGWERRPPGLKDCAMRPQDIEEIIEGEKTGKYLFSCKEAIVAGVMNSFDEQGKPTCYGYRETESESNQAENYYCCE